MKRLLFYVTVVAALCMCLGFAAMASFAHAEGFQTSAQAAVVMERSSHRVLYQKNANARLPMASTTKIVTALTVLNCCSAEDVVEVPEAAVGIEGSSVYLRKGEHLTVKELLLGLMLRSGNDCAVALALHAAGSIEHFAELMNKTAEELGCTDSHFVNPHGLHDSDHYTSARDLALITCAALQNPLFSEIVATKKAEIANEGMEYNRVLLNKNKLLSNFEDADGVKTGYTKKAGRCFVGSATRNGMQVVAVVLNCGPMFEETAELLQNAFEQYRLQTVIPQNKMCGTHTERGRVMYCYCPERLTYPLRPEESVSCKIDLDKLSIEAFLNGESIWSHSLALMYSNGKSASLAH